MDMHETNDCECFFQHTSVFNLCGYNNPEEADKCPTKATHTTPLIIVGTEPNNNNIVRVTLYGDGNSAEAYFQVDALRDLIDHAAHGRGMFR